MSNKTQTAIVLFSVAGLIVVIAMLLSCCATRPVYQQPPVVKAEINPCWPDPCPPGTNWIPRQPQPLNTNVLWVEIVDLHVTGEPTYWVVTAAHNLTNGSRYLWERTQTELGQWIPLEIFTAIDPTRYRTNGILNPGHHYWRISQFNQ